MNRNHSSAHCRAATRRQFLQVAGAGAAFAYVGGVGFAAAKKLPLKLGLASYSTRKFDLDKTIVMAKQCGLGYLCLKSMHLPLEATPEQIAAAVAKVKSAGLVLYGCGVVSMGKEQQVQQAFEYAKKAGMKVIVAMPQPAMLPVVEKMVKQYDICVAIHNHGPGDKVWPTPDVIMEKIAPLDKRIGLCIDIGHTVRVGADLLALTKKYAERIHDVHMKDVTEATPKGKSTICGRGIIDLPGFLRVLIATKYAGVVSFEYEDEPENPLPGLEASVKYVQGLLGKM